MISLPGDRSIYLYMKPTDMRNSFRGLCSLIYQHSGRPDDGSYYVFINRPKTHVKIMFWDGDGMAMFYNYLDSYYTSLWLQVIILILSRIFTHKSRSIRYEIPSASFLFW